MREAAGTACRCCRSGPSFKSSTKFRDTAWPAVALPDTLAPKSSAGIHPYPLRGFSVLPRWRGQPGASGSLCQAACTLACSALREPLSSVAAATGRARSSGVFTAQGFWESWAGPAWANSLLQMLSFRHFPIPQNVLLPNYFMTRITAKEPLDSSLPWCLAPAEKGWHQGLEDFGRCPPSAARPARSFPRGLPFFLPSLPLCVLQLQHKLFAREVSLYDPIQHTQEKTVGDRPNVLTNLS